MDCTSAKWMTDLPLPLQELATALAPIDERLLGLLRDGVAELQRPVATNLSQTKSAGPGTREAVVVEGPSENTLVSFPEISFAAPRGSFTVDVMPDGFAMRGKAGSFRIYAREVGLVVTLPDKAAGDAVLVVTSNPALGTGGLLLALPKLKGVMPIPPPPGDGVADIICGILAGVKQRDKCFERLLSVALGRDIVDSAVVTLDKRQVSDSIGAPAAAFKSVSRGGMPGVPCHVNVIKEGTVWFLQECMVFTQTPLLFIPVDNIASWEIVRSTPKTFDLTVTPIKGMAVEFSMIDAAERPGVVEYLGHARRRMIANAASGAVPSAALGADGQTATTDDEDEDDEEDDEDGDSLYESSETSSSGEVKPDEGDMDGVEEDDAAADDSDSRSSSSEEEDEADGESRAEVVEEEPFVPDSDAVVLSGKRRRVVLTG